MWLWTSRTQGPCAVKIVILDNAPPFISIINRLAERRSSFQWLDHFGRIHMSDSKFLVGFTCCWIPPLWPGSATPLQPHSNLFSLPCSILHPAQSNEVADRILPLALPGLFGDINLILFLRWTFIYLLTFAPHKKSYTLAKCGPYQLQESSQQNPRGFLEPISLLSVYSILVNSETKIKIFFSKHWRIYYKKRGISDGDRTPVSPEEHWSKKSKIAGARPFHPPAVVRSSEAPARTMHLSLRKTHARVSLQFKIRQKRKVGMGKCHLIEIRPPRAQTLP